MPGDIAINHEMRHATAMSGPEFLDAVADAESANNNDINADIYRRRALEWAQDKRTIASLRDELQAANDRLDEVRRAAAMVR